MDINRHRKGEANHKTIRYLERRKETEEAEKKKERKRQIEG